MVMAIVNINRRQKWLWKKKPETTNIKQREMKQNFASCPIIRCVVAAIIKFLELNCVCLCIFFSGAFHNEISTFEVEPKRNKWETKNKTKSLMKEKRWNWNNGNTELERNVPWTFYFHWIFCHFYFIIFPFIRGFGEVSWSESKQFLFNIQCVLPSHFFWCYEGKKNGKKTRKVSSISGNCRKT